MAMAMMDPSHLGVGDEQRDSLDHWLFSSRQLKLEKEKRTTIVLPTDEWTYGKTAPLK